MTRSLLLLVASLFISLPVYAQPVDTAWVRSYNGPANSYDEATAIAVDNSGNVYVTGGSENVAGDDDFVTIKYLANGDTAWLRTYNGPGNDGDRGNAVAVDASGNAYVTGNSKGSMSYDDYATIKYYPNGDTAWVRRYNGLSDTSDAAWAVDVDQSGGVYVTGRAHDIEFYDDYVTIKYNPDGTWGWGAGYNGDAAASYDQAAAIQVDDSGYVYVTGESGITHRDYATIKYSPTGSRVWAKRYNGPGNDYDAAWAMAVDGSGNVYVAGGSTGGSVDYATIKYNSNGDTAWVRRYDGPANDWDEAYAIAVDGSGNVYVTGFADGWISGDILTIKYYPNGDTAWVRRYSGSGDGFDGGLGVAVDDSGNVYVAGPGTGNGTGFDYTTIKYDSTGSIVWVQTYDGPASGSDWLAAMRIDAAGNVYVTGSSHGVESDADCLTIKYTQNQLLRGDANGDGLIDLGDGVYILNYLFKGGPTPDPLEAGDANCDAVVDLGDAVYILNYLFKGGPAPGC